MKYTIDRIVGGIAVLEGYDGSDLELTACRLPKGAKAGSAIEIDGENIELFVDSERSAKVAELMKKVWR